MRTNTEHCITLEISDHGYLTERELHQKFLMLSATVMKLQLHTPISLHLNYTYVVSFQNFKVL